MKLPELPKCERSVRQFLIKLIPQLLRTCGISPEQRFYGIRINIQREATKRILCMSEEQAKTALESLMELLEEWDGEASKK